MLDVTRLILEVSREWGALVVAVLSWVVSVLVR